MENFEIKQDKEDLGITIEAMFKGMDGLLNTKTVVGQEIRIGDMTVLPLIEVTAGMASGVFGESAAKNGAGAMAAKMTPVALFIIQDGKTRLVNIRNQDAVTKIIDTASDAIPQLFDKLPFRRVKGEDAKKAKKAVEELGAFTEEY